MESKYLERFQKLEANDLPLRGNRILIEVLPKEEIKQGSIIVASNLDDHRSSTEQNRADLGVVLAVGSGYFDDETGGDVAMDIQPGNVVLVSRMGLKLYSQFPGISGYTKETIALTRDNEIHCAWASLEAYQAYREKLNK